MWDSRVKWIAGSRVCIHISSVPRHNLCCERRKGYLIIDLSVSLSLIPSLFSDTCMCLYGCVCVCMAVAARVAGVSRGRRKRVRFLPLASDGLGTTRLRMFGSILLSRSNAFNSAIISLSLVHYHILRDAWRYRFDTLMPMLSLTRRSCAIYICIFINAIIITLGFCFCVDGTGKLLSDRWIKTFFSLFSM